MKKEKVGKNAKRGVIAETRRETQWFRVNAGGTAEVSPCAIEKIA